ASLSRGPLPTILVTAAVTTTTLERSGSAAPGLSTSRSAAGTRWASRARHITSSQETRLARLTWLATQAAARSRIATWLSALLRAGTPAGGVRRTADPAESRNSPPTAPPMTTRLVRPRPRGRDGPAGVTGAPGGGTGFGGRVGPGAGRARTLPRL